MSWLNERTSNRRDFLLRSIPGAAAVAAGAASVLKSEPAHAKAPKKSVKYQQKPKGDQKCSNCSFWMPPEGGAQLGQCKIVAGEIHPNGWCNLWASA